jgi:hypothetical protein
MTPPPSRPEAMAINKTSRWPSFDENKVSLLMQYSLGKHTDLPSVPLVMDLAKTDEQRTILKLIFGRQVMGRPFAVPPGVPGDRVDALRNAFMETMADKEFLTDAEKAKIEVRPVSTAAAAAFEKCCRRRGHGLSAVYDPERPSTNLNLSWSRFHRVRRRSQIRSVPRVARLYREVCHRGLWNRNPGNKNVLLTYNNCPVPWPLRVCH